MKKRILAVFLAAMLGLTLLLPVSAAGDLESGTFEYKQVIAPQYQDAKRASEGLFPVKQNGKWGYVDENNRTVIPFIYDVANPFSEGYAVVGKYGTVTDSWYGDSSDVIFLGRVDKSGNYKPFRSWQENLLYLRQT